MLGGSWAQLLKDLNLKEGRNQAECTPHRGLGRGIHGTQAPAGPSLSTALSFPLRAFTPSPQTLNGWALMSAAFNVLLDLNSQTVQPLCLPACVLPQGMVILAITTEVLPAAGRRAPSAEREEGGLRASLSQAPPPLLVPLPQSQGHENKGLLFLTVPSRISATKSTSNNERGRDLKYSRTKRKPGSDQEGKGEGRKDEDAGGRAAGRRLTVGLCAATHARKGGQSPVRRALRGKLGLFYVAQFSATQNVTATNGSYNLRQVLRFK